MLSDGTRCMVSGVDVSIRLHPNVDRRQINGIRSIPIPSRGPAQSQAIGTGGCGGAGNDGKVNISYCIDAFPPGSVLDFISRGKIAVVSDEVCSSAEESTAERKPQACRVNARWWC